ncbi:MAG: YfcE family phosphodiesterase [Desulfobacterales bacterium]|nr:MAG: YfcE family phosphodiesterase [Desulfobacterales bacterium]
MDIFPGHKTDASAKTTDSPKPANPDDAREPVLIGVISDTHGLLRPEAVQALAGVDMILHAGDIGSLDVLHALERIAPVTAVAGNMDPYGLAGLQGTAAPELGGGLSAWLLHDLSRLDLLPETAGFAAVISGHTHRPDIRKKNGILYMNPGSAGPRRFDFPVTIGIIRRADATLHPEIIHLSV